MKLATVPVDDYVKQKLAQLSKFDGPGGASRYKDKEQSAERRREYLRNYNAVWKLTDKGKENRKKNNRAKNARRRLKGKRQASGDVNTFYNDTSVIPSIPCTYCKKPLTLSERHIDHVIPLAKGGTNDYDNLTVACAVCNNKKSDKWPSEFEREMGIHSWC